jgi:hypothetical protein
MKNPLFLILLAFAIFAGGVLSARFFIGGGEDVWICENGRWIRHGNPSAPMPSDGCGEAVTPEPVLTGGQVVGGDRDEHGCIGSAGYTWCEAKAKCVRTWEEPCTPEGFDEQVLLSSIREQLVAKHGESAGDLIVTASRVEGMYAQGGAKPGGGDIGGGMWFAVNTGGSWKMIWDGNGSILCKDITAYPEFPVSMIPECYDEASGQTVER